MQAAMITPAQQAELQNMMNQAFETRMKKELFPDEDAQMVKFLFLKVLKNFSFNTINIQAKELDVISDKNEGFTYFEVGTMLNCIMSASFEKNGVPDGIKHVVTFIESIEPLQDHYNEFVARCRKSSQSEVKTKLRLQNSPLERYL